MRWKNNCENIIELKFKAFDYKTTTTFQLYIYLLHFSNVQNMPFVEFHFYWNISNSIHYWYA